MSEEKDYYYLEKVEESKNTYKFYELTRKGSSVTATFGRIGATGTTKETTFKTEAEAHKFFIKKLSEKEKKNYQKAIKGYRTSKKGTSKGQLHFNFYLSPKPSQFK